MKKILALVLALVMLAAAGIASAATLELTPGTPTNCTIDVFKTYFQLLASNAGYDFTWEETPTKEGAYDVYTATTATTPLVIKVYCSGEKVVFGTGEGTITFAATSNTDALKNFGEWFGVSLADICVCIFIGEQGPQAVTNEVGTKLQEELNPLVLTLQNGLTNLDDLMNGVAGVATCLGYPCGLEVSGTVDGSNITMTMTVAVTGMDGILTVK